MSHENGLTLPGTLRKTAEKRLREKGSELACVPGRVGDEKLINELQIHEIELQLQNDELIKINDVADKLRQQYQTLFDVAPVGYLLLGPGSMVLQSNHRAAELFGTTKKGLIGRRLTAFLNQQTLPLFNAFFSDCCTKETWQSSDFTCTLNPDPLSEPQHLHFAGKAPQSDKEHLQCLVVVTDITELYQYQEAFREVSKKLHIIANVARQDILDQIRALSMGHELILTMMQKGEPVDHLFALCRASFQAIEQHIQFINDYEYLGREESVWQSVGAIIETVSQKISIPVTVDPSVGQLEIYADMMLPKVFSNLFQNTEQHGEDAGMITVSCYQDKSAGILVIEDDGIGLPDDMKNLIFDYNIEEETGLGLFFSSEILKITGISIDETGTPGEGARFELHMPAGVWRYGTKLS